MQCEICGINSLLFETLLLCPLLSSKQFNCTYTKKYQNIAYFPLPFIISLHIYRGSGTSLVLCEACIALGLYFDDVC